MTDPLKSLFIEQKEGATEADMLERIRLRVADLLDKNAELLFSYLYRLDVEEVKIKIALNSGEPTDEALAKLIWERQKQRLATRKAYREDHIEDDMSW